MKVYTFDTEEPSVIERECEVFGYPNRDSAGKTQYENTHFRTFKEAAAYLVVELEAGMSLISANRAELRRRLQEVTDRLADDAERLVRAKEIRAGAPEAK